MRTSIRPTAKSPHADGTTHSARPGRRGPQGTASLAKTMELLDMIGLAEQPPTFIELATRSGLPRGTLHRLLAALSEHGMVELSELDRRYTPGIHLLTLAQRTWVKMDLRRAAAEPILALNGRTGETVHLATLSGDAIVYIDKVECNYPLRLHSAIGRRGPIHCTAVGKVMAAYLAPDEQQALVHRLDLQRHTPTTLATPAALLKALKRIHAEGVAFDYEEHVVGNHCVAAPVFDFRGRCVGGVSITAPRVRVNSAQLEGFADWVREAAAAVGARLGGAVPQRPAMTWQGGA
jgi:DNA-binding IclR family transcriptional regulator